MLEYLWAAKENNNKMVINVVISTDNNNYIDSILPIHSCLTENSQNVVNLPLYY